MNRLLRLALVASAAVHLVALAALHPAARETAPLPPIEARLLAAVREPPSEPVTLSSSPPERVASSRFRPQPPRPVLTTPVAASRSVPVPAAVPVEATAPPALAAPAVVMATAPVAVVEPPRYDAAYLANPPPAYPASARRRGIEGTTTVEARVGPGGEAREVKLAASAGDAALDGAALEAVRGWRFVPARRGDLAVEAWVRIPLVFRLN